VLKKLRK